MASRESINRVKIEEHRASRVPVDPDVDFYQGDLLVWDVNNRIAAPFTSVSAATFLGMAEGQNPVPSAGVLTSDSRVSRTNVIQKGLVELIFDESATVKPGDLVTIGTTSVQHVKKTGATSSNDVGEIAFENDFDSATGKALVQGDLVLIRLHVPADQIRE